MAYVVVIDDEPNMRELTKQVLKGGGFDVATAESGSDFLEKIDSGDINPEKTDAVLIDMMMPGMNGKELCEKMCTEPKLKDIPRALLTIIEYDKAGIPNLKEIGVLDYIQKPYHNEDLIQRVTRLCQKRKHAKS